MKVAIALAARELVHIAILLTCWYECKFVKLDSRVEGFVVQRMVLDRLACFTTAHAEWCLNTKRLQLNVCLVSRGRIKRVPVVFMPLRTLVLVLVLAYHELLLMRGLL